MKPVVLNLAERPFVNERPVRRTAMLLWIVGATLLVLNVGVYERHWSGQQEKRATIDLIESRRTDETNKLRELQVQFADLGVDDQNSQIQFLNTQIAKRTFSWSNLMDRLAEVLPETVQLRRVTPRVTDSDDSRRSRAGVGSENTVTVEMSGVARSDEALLAFVDALFAHPIFAAPNLANESQQEGNLDQFSLSVLYLPDRQPPVEQPEVVK